MAKKLEEMCRNELLFEPVIVGVGIFYENEYVYVNPSFASIFGYVREEIIHKVRLVDLIHPDDRNFVADQVRQRLAGEAASARYLARGVRKDGGVIELEVCGARTVYQGTSAVITMILDMTEQVQIAQALRESDERFRKAFDYSSIGMALISIEGQFLKVNPALCTMTGYTEEELLAKTYRMITHADDIVDDRERFEQLVDGGINHVSYEKRYIHKCGRAIWILVNVSIVRDESNVPLYFIAQMQDVTERKQTEEMLRKSERLNAVGQLAAGVAHEVRNPLTVLKGFIQLMQAQREDEQPEHLELMLSEVERIEAIITEFLVLAKPQTIRFRTNDLAAIISHVAALISTKAVMSNIQISTRIAADLPHIECDENQIKQVFVNMLQNAVESMPEGGLIMVTAARLGADRVMIRFIDEGCGIAQERIPHLGEPFYSNKEKGTGLGLMISYKIIENHKGTIKVESRLGKGTVFTIILPLSQLVEKPYES